MFELSRRQALAGAALAAAFGLSKNLFIDPAFAQQTPDPAKGWHTYKIGDAKITAIYDGIFEKPHDPAFITNASITEVKEAMVKAGLSPDFVSISGTVAIVQNRGKTIMIDSGTGGQAAGWVGGKLPAGMKAAGIDPAKIDIILVSHMHPDHIFGLMEKETNRLLYPNAEIIVSDVEYKFWTDPAVIDKLPAARKVVASRIQATFPSWKNVRQVTGEVEVAPGIRTVMAPGHTPGHRAFHLSSGGSQLMLSNDTMYVPALNVANPGWRGQYDQDAALAEDSRRKLMDRIVADKMPVAGFHFPVPGVGSIVRDGEGYALTVAKA